MHISLPIALRRYGDGFCIAELLYGMPGRATAEDFDEAKLRLEAQLIDRLERAHPRLIWDLVEAPRFETHRVDLPVYQRSEGGDSELSVPVDVLVERRRGKMVRLHLPAFEAEGWSRENPEHTPARATERWPGLDRLARQLRAEGHDCDHHRPPPGEYRVDLLEMKLDPLDLSEAPCDELWRSWFDESDLGGEEDDQAPATPKLESVAQRWTIDDGDERRRRGFEPAYGRRNLLRQIRRLVGSGRPTPVVLVGPSRVGKTALVRHLAWESAAGAEGGAPTGPTAEPEEHLDQPIWFADPARLTSAESPFGGWQQQSADIVDELRETGHVLYLGRLADSLDAGKHVGSDYNLAQFLKPHLAERDIRCIAEATVDEWNAIERRDIGFARTFEVIRVSEPTGGRGKRIVDWAVRRLAKQHGVRLTETAVERIWQLQTRFAAEGSPVGTAIDFAERLLRGAAQAFRDELDVGDVVDRFCEETGLPNVLLRDDRSLDLADVRDRLAERVMGQPQAVERVADVIGITKAGLGARDRPFGSFFFVGPTGVGKTELARAVADFLFGDEDRLIRLDMSEYASPGAYGRLLGEHSGEGELTAPVRRQPFSVILLDEIEKAHTSVYDVLLQVLGEARLTDAQGRTTRFQNTIVILTSNLGVESAGGSIGFGGAAPEGGWEDHFRKAAEDFFRPEFLGRIDQFIPFQPLPREVVRRIAARQIDRLDQRDGIRSQNVTLDVDDEVADWVAEHGWDERYGARPIERVVEQKLAWRLASELARAGPAPDGQSWRAGLSVGDDAIDVTMDVDRAGGRREQARQSLSKLVDRAAHLRRRVQTYLDSGPFRRLVDRVTDYDRSSQQADFWEAGSDAADAARQAEDARDIVEPARELAEELEAVEDLAREAYHDQSWELGSDLRPQLDQLHTRVEQLMAKLLATTTADPNHALLVLAGEEAESERRDTFVEWYRRLANRRGWRFQLWQGIPPADRNRGIGVGDRFQRGEVWRRQRSPQGRTLALEFEGPAARPLLKGEDGRHRLLEIDDRTDLDVHWMEPARSQPDGTGWPHPDQFDPTVPRKVVRVWDLAEERIRLVGGDSAETSVPLDDNDPWRRLFPTIRRAVWEAL